MRRRVALLAVFIERRAVLRLRCVTERGCSPGRGEHERWLGRLEKGARVIQVTAARAARAQEVAAARLLVMG